MVDTLTIAAGIGAGLLTAGSGVVCKKHHAPALAFVGRDPICPLCMEDGTYRTLAGWRDVRDPEWLRQQEGAR